MNGIDVLLIVAALALLLAVERYVAWRDFDNYRRLSRKAHRNIDRAIGGPR